MRESPNHQSPAREKCRVRQAHTHQAKPQASGWADRPEHRDHARHRPRRGIEPWSQTSAAYSQLARENPWYFAYRYNRKFEDYDAESPIDAYITLGMPEELQLIADMDDADSPDFWAD